MRNYIIICAFFIGFISCEKDVYEPPTSDTENFVEPSTSDEEHFVIAGSYDSSYVHMQFVPDYLVNPNHINCLDMWGNDSLDINMDGNYDLVFEIFDINQSPDNDCCPESEDSNIVVDCWPSNYPFFSLTLKDSIEILNHNTIDEFWSTCFVDTLNFNDTINNRNNWASEKTMYFYNYNKFETGGYGSWTNFNSSKYLAFRFHENGIEKYGWINIEKNDYLVFKEIAYQK